MLLILSLLGAVYSVGVIVLADPIMGSASALIFGLAVTVLQRSTTTRLSLVPPAR